MLYQDPQDIYHSVHKHTLEWAYTIFRHFTLLAFLNTHTHSHTHRRTHFPRYTVNYSSGTTFDSADLPSIQMNSKHDTEIYILYILKKYYTHTNHPLTFLDISLCYMTLGPVAGKWQLFCSSSLLLRDSQNTLSACEGAAVVHRENCSQKHTLGLYLSYTHTHINAERCNKRAGLWPGHVTDGPLERVQKNISQSKLMPFKCTQLPLAGQLSELKEYLMTVCLALS